jgi:hypothetical protein
MKITQSVKNRSWIDTQKCYCRALKETYPEVLKAFDEAKFKNYGYDKEMRVQLDLNGLEDRSHDIHRRYMAHVLQLSTKKLELIIECDKQGLIRRGPGTIDEIAYELLDRAVKESETKENT